MSRKFGALPSWHKAIFQCLARANHAADDSTGTHADPDSSALAELALALVGTVLAAVIGGTPRGWETVMATLTLIDR